eukprot:998447_1
MVSFVTSIAQKEVRFIMTTSTNFTRRAPDVLHKIQFSIRNSLLPIFNKLSKSIRSRDLAELRLAQGTSIVDLRPGLNTFKVELVVAAANSGGTEYRLQTYWTRI